MKKLTSKQAKRQLDDLLKRMRELNSKLPYGNMMEAIHLVECCVRTEEYYIKLEEGA